MTTPIKRGDLEPPLEVTLSDKRDEVDFTTVTTGMVTVHLWLNEAEIVNGPPTSVLSQDAGKGLIVKRAWQSGETDDSGRAYGYCVVAWPGGRQQSFPADGYFILEIRKDPGDA